MLPIDFDYNSVSADPTFKSSLGYRKPNTKKNYAKALFKYCKMLDRTPTEIINDALDEQDNINIKERHRKVRVYLVDFRESLDKEDLAPSTRIQYMKCVRNFYKYNDVELKPERLSTPEMLSVNFYIPKFEEVREAVMHTKLRNKCIILLQCSSGMGSSEIVSLRKQDFIDGYDEASEVTTWHPVRAKTGRRYVTFCSPECSRMIKLWLEECERNNDKAESLFGLTNHGIQTMYQRLSEESGFPHVKGKFHRFRSHNMRKVFNQYLRDHKMNADMVDFLSGRKEKGSRSSYHIYDEAELKTEYLEHIGAVTFIDIIKQMTDKEIIEKLNELEELKGAVASLLITNQDTKAAMKDFVEWFIEFQKESGEVTQGISKSMEDLFERIKNMK